jgi:hypothetical protein
VTLHGPSPLAPERYVRSFCAPNSTFATVSRAEELANRELA